MSAIRIPQVRSLVQLVVYESDHKYEFRNLFSQRGVSALTQREGMNYYSDKAIRKWESLYTGRTTYSGQLGGTHTLQEDINKVDWTAGYAFAAYRGTGPQDRQFHPRRDEDGLIELLRLRSDALLPGLEGSRCFAHLPIMNISSLSPTSSPLFLTVVSTENIKTVRSMPAASVTTCWARAMPVMPIGIIRAVL